MMFLVVLWVEGQEIYNGGRVCHLVELYMKNLNLEWCRSVERFSLTPHRPRSEEINGR